MPLHAPSPPRPFAVQSAQAPHQPDGHPRFEPQALLRELHEADQQRDLYQRADKRQQRHMQSER